MSQIGHNKDTQSNEFIIRNIKVFEVEHRLSDCLFLPHQKCMLCLKLQNVIVDEPQTEFSGRVHSCSVRLNPKLITWRYQTVIFAFKSTCPTNVW